MPDYRTLKMPSELVKELKILASCRGVTMIVMLRELVKFWKEMKVE